MYTFNNICTADDINIVILYVTNLEIVDIRTGIFYFYINISHFSADATCHTKYENNQNLYEHFSATSQLKVCYSTKLNVLNINFFLFKCENKCYINMYLNILTHKFRSHKKITPRSKLT